MRKNTDISVSRYLRMFCGVAAVLCAVQHVWAVTATLDKNYPSGSYALLDASAWIGGNDIFPDPAVDYYVGAGGVVRTKSDQDITFSGRSLTIGNSENNGYATLALRTGNDYGDRVLQFTGEDGLILSRGALENWNSCCTVVSGKVSVTSTSARPFVVYAGTLVSFVNSERDVNCQLEGELKSDENARLLFHSTAKLDTVVRAYYRILSDMSEYLGLISVVQTSKGNSTKADRVTLELGKNDFGGTLLMEHRTTLEAYELGSTVKIKNLELKHGAALSLKWDGATRKGSGFAVENSLVLETPVQVRPSRFNSAHDDNGFAIALLKAPTGVKLNADDFEFVASCDKDVDEYISPVVGFEVAEDADGRDVLWVKSLPIKRSSGDDASGKTGSLCYDPNAPASNWPDGEEAKPEFDYVSAHTLRSLPSSAGITVFSGNSLTMKPTSSKTLALRCPKIVIPDFRIDLTSNNVAFDNYGGGDKTTNSAFATYGTMAIQGKLKILSDANGSNRLYIYPADKGLVRIDSDISGNGNIESRLTGNNSTRCYFELAGDNSKWKGRLIASKAPSDNNAYSCILFRESENLGGAMSSFTRNAVHLGDSGRLWPLQSVTLAEPTRGIHIGGGYCKFEVNEGVVFTLHQRISYAGTLTKIGTGTLALGGGRPLFSSEEDTPPTEGKNILSIAEGTLTPLSSDAFDGIAVKFSEGTRIALAVPESFDEGVGRWGMALTNEFSSISLPEGGIRVSLAEGAEPPSRNFAIPICTVRSVAAEALRSGLITANRNPFPWYMSDIKENDNGNGTVTFTLSTYRTGLVIGVR